MDAFPAAFPLHGRRIVVAGDGEAADAKARLFEGSPAEVVRLRGTETRTRERYGGASLAFIALPAAAAVEAAAAARAAGALVNVVDRPELCDFNTPAIVDRGVVVGAVLTGGAAPALSAELRLSLEALWPAELGQVAVLLDRLKAASRARLPDPAARRTFLRRLIRGPAGEAALAGRMAEAEALGHATLEATRPEPARAILIQAPAAPDLLSLRALRWLSEADRVVADAGIDPALSRLARRDAPVVVLPERPAATPAILRTWLGDSLVLVRLCATDPRSEADAWVAAGVAAELV